MPYCDDCDRFLNPSTLTEDGACPTCHAVVAETGTARSAAKSPWHFKLLVAAICGYLGWRFVQLLQWLF
ncbi:MAG TPA: hypothetical protein VMW08_03890 [Acidimicrobiales bacterium]|nr:hypothetical protein [Acidimicrobiales bacterium]